MGQPVEWIGYLMHGTGAVCCGPCWRRGGSGGSTVPNGLQGQGYAIPIYIRTGDRYLVSGLCALCAAPVAGEIAEKSARYVESTRVDSRPQA
jgi:hypothetical protein